MYPFQSVCNLHIIIIIIIIIIIVIMVFLSLWAPVPLRKRTTREM